MSEEWAFAGPKYGWSLRMVQGKRRLVYMTPQKDLFAVGVVLGDKAVTAANESDLPRALLEELNGSRRHARGRGVRMEVKSAVDLDVIKLLADIKAAG